MNILPYQIWINVTLQWTFKDRLNYWTIIDFKLSNLQNSHYWLSVFKTAVAYYAIMKPR